LSEKKTKAGTRDGQRRIRRDAALAIDDSGDPGYWHAAAEMSSSLNPLARCSLG
jgi:hypothetical protein